MKQLSLVLCVSLGIKHIKPKTVVSFKESYSNLRVSKNESLQICQQTVIFGPQINYFIQLINVFFIL